MKIAVQKPEFLPGMEFFDRINASDILVLLDSVRLSRRDPVARTKILSPEGPDWVHIPLERSGKQGQVVHMANIDYTKNWLKNLKNRLYHSYSSAPYFEDIYPAVCNILDSKFDYVSQLNEALIIRICTMLQIDCRIMRSSEMEISGDGDELLLNIVREAGGTVLVIPEYAADFIDTGFMGENGIEVEFRNFTIPQYNQYREEFYTGLSIFDTFCFCGRYQLHTQLAAAR